MILTFIIAGEVSGDTHAAGLMREMLAHRSDVQFHGLGGPRMRETVGAGIEDWVETAGVLGLWEVLKMYGYFRAKMDEVLERVMRDQPAAVILVDYPGFNLRAAKALRARRYTGKIIFYISPQVWAWKKGRVPVMARLLDLMVCIFPFEKELYERSGLSTVFSGHPLVDRVAALRRNWEREPGLVGWFPGSRAIEIGRLFPVMLAASREIRARLPSARFAVSAANETLAEVMRRMAEQCGMPEAKTWIEVGTVYDLMQRAQAGAVASGTATLEAACFGLPYVLVYKVNAITYRVAKSVVKIKHIGIVNVLAKRTVVRELVQGDLTADALAAEMLDLLSDQRRREELREELAAVVSTLGQGGAYHRAAEAILRCLPKPYPDTPADHER